MRIEDRSLVDALTHRARWISAPGADGPGSWLLRRDVVLAPLLTDPSDGSDLTLRAAEIVVASTGDARVLLDGEEILDVRSLGGVVAGAGRADVTEHLFIGGTLTDHLSLGIVHIEDRPAADRDGAPASVLAALVLHVESPSGDWTGEETRPVVLGTDTSWTTSPAGISFEPRDEPGRRMLEIHRLGDDLDLSWTRFGAPHAEATGSSRTWRAAIDRGAHPSLVHPDVVIPPPLVEERLVSVGERVLAPGGVQCFDLGGPVRSRPVLPVPEGARRPMTVWAGSAPGTPPRGGDIRAIGDGEAGLLESHGTVSGRWLHVHGVPDLEASGTVVPIRVGILPRQVGLEVSDEDLIRSLADGFTGLAARCQETYLGEDDVPLLADVARTARAALLLGADRWRSERALEAFLATARPSGTGTVVDAIAPGGPTADLDEHTFALPGWIAAQFEPARPSRRAGSVAGGIARRILDRAEHGPDPAARMTTLVAALDALAAVRRMRRTAGAGRDEQDRELVACATALRERGRAGLRAHRAAEGRGTWVEGAGELAPTVRATALAVLGGLLLPEDVARTRAALRGALDDPGREDVRGLVRAALVRLGDGRSVISEHRTGDDVPPALLVELLLAASGLAIEGDRIHVRTPTLPVDAIELVLPHPRGEVSIRWDGPHGTVEAPEGTHVLHHREGGSEPVWYNSGTTAVERPEPPA